MPDVVTSPDTGRAPAPRGASDPSTEEGAHEDLPRRRASAEPTMQVRAADLEPYVGLKYLSRLFKLMAVVLILLLISEVITGLMTDGIGALPRLLAEVSRLIVLAGLLWGAGDLAILFIDIGHDMRATRILIGRQLAHHMDEQHAHVDPGLAPVSATSANTSAKPATSGRGNPPAPPV